MNFIDPDYYITEQNVSDFPSYPFSIPPRLLEFLQGPVSDLSVSRKRLGSVPECTEQAKYLCRNLLEEVDNNLELIEENLHPELCAKQREVRSGLRRKLKREKILYREKVSRLRREHNKEMERLDCDLEKRRELLLREMMVALERQKENVKTRLNTSAAISAHNLMASAGNADNNGQVLTRKLRKRANEEAAATSVSPELSAGLALEGHLTLNPKGALKPHEDSLMDVSLAVVGGASLADASHEEEAAVKYEESGRIKGPGNSITLTGNGFRVDSLLAKLEVKLSDEDIMKDLMTITKGKYKLASCSQSTVGSTGASSSKQSGSNGGDVKTVHIQPEHPLSQPMTSSKHSVQLEDKSLHYDSMVLTKGQQVYVEGHLKGVFSILGISQTELQLKKINDSTKIKINFDMLRRGTYRITDHKP